MTQPNLRELAKQGNPQAITRLLQRKIQSQDITVKAGTKQNCLMILLESEQIPDEQAGEVIKEEVGKLGISFLHVIKVCGRRKGDVQLTWIKEFEIAGQVQLSSTLPIGCVLRKAESSNKSQFSRILVINSFFCFFLVSFGALILWSWLLDEHVFTLFILLLPFFVSIFIWIFTYSSFITLWGDFWLIEHQGQIVAHGALNGKEIQLYGGVSMKIFLVTLILFSFLICSLLFGFLAYVFFLDFLDSMSFYPLAALLLIALIMIAVLILYINFIKKMISKKTIKHFRKKSYIVSLFVEPGWRRKGLGSAIVKRLIQEANRPLYVKPSPESVEFYAKLGFVKSSLDKEYMVYN